MSRLVPAGELPSTFLVSSTFGGSAIGRAHRYGVVVAVTIMGHTVHLAPSQRVMVLS